MAIYHLRAKVISRGKGKSATASAAYQSAEKIKDERTGLTFDYTRKQGVNATEIIAPNPAPDWVNNRSSLWNNAELFETRKNSRTAREIELALPIELNQESNQELVRGFVKDELISKGLVADLAFHNMDSHNPHAHIMFTTRVVEEKGWGIKDRSLDKKEWILQIRESWTNHVNQALEQAGESERIDHRSLEAQGVNRIPQIHLGANVAAMMKKGIATERGEIYLGIIAANQEIEALERELEVTEQLIEDEPRKIPPTQATENPTSSLPPISLTSHQRSSLEEEEEKEQQNASWTVEWANLDSQKTENPTSNQLSNAPLINLEEEEQKKASWTLEFANLDSQKTENAIPNQLSETQLMTLEKQWSDWKIEDKYHTYRQQKQKQEISQEIKKLQKCETQLKKTLAAQKQKLAQMKPRSLLNPLGHSSEVIKKQQKAIALTQNQLHRLQGNFRNCFDEIKQGEKEHQTWLNNPHHQKMREYGKLRETPEISERIQAGAEKQYIHKVAEFYLELGGKSINNKRSVEGNNYRIAQLGKTISITNKHSGELLYLSTDEREKGGIIEVKEFKLTEEDKKAISQAPRYLGINQEQKLNSRGIER